MTDPLEEHLRNQVEHSGRFFWHRLRWRVVRPWLPTDVPYELVDIGAGAGLLGAYLARDRPNATYRFIEPIESLRTSLCERFGTEHDADGAVDYHTARFVTLLDVIEHEDDDRALLADVVGKMAPGATLIVTVPALPRLWSRWDELLGHHRRYDEAMLLAATAGLPISVQEVRFLFPEMIPLARFRQWDRSRSKEVDELAEFPDLPRIANDALYGLGVVSLALTRRWKRGTSLFFAARVEH